MTTENKFKVGDRVKRTDGKTFSNGELVCTISKAPRLNRYKDLDEKLDGILLRSSIGDLR